MKRICYCLMAVTILLAACNNKKPKETTITSEDGKEKVTMDVNDMAKASDDAQKKADELSKMKPLSLDELKALLPETMMGAKRTNMNVTNAIGYGNANAEYKIDDTTRVKLNILDCAGSAGAGIYNLQYLSMYNYEQESDDEYTKTISYGDGKGYEHCQKTRNDCTLTWFAGGRYLVTLDGDNVNADGLKQAGKELHLK